MTSARLDELMMTLTLQAGERARVINGRIVIDLNPDA